MKARGWKLPDEMLPADEEDEEERPAADGWMEDDDDKEDDEENAAAKPSPPPPRDSSLELFASNNATGFKGVYHFKNGSFLTQFWDPSEKKDVNLGVSDTAHEAALVYARHQAARGVYAGQKGHAVAKPPPAKAKAAPSAAASSSKAAGKRPAAAPAPAAVKRPAAAAKAAAAKAAAAAAKAVTPAAATEGGGRDARAAKRAAEMAKRAGAAPRSVSRELRGLMSAAKTGAKRKEESDSESGGGASGSKPRLNSASDKEAPGTPELAGHALKECFPTGQRVKVIGGAFIGSGGVVKGHLKSWVSVRIDGADDVRSLRAGNLKKA